MQLPEGSKIRIEQSNSDTVIIVPYKYRIASKYEFGIFMIFCLGGWVWGLTKQIDSSPFSSEVGPASWFVMLIFWIFIGIFIGHFVYRIFRPSVNESITLTTDGVKYDSGIPPFQVDSHENDFKETWRMIHPKRTMIEFSRTQIETLSLRQTESGNRLTVDVGVKRMEIGVGASDVEREWLFKTIKQKYFLN